MSIDSDLFERAYAKGYRAALGAAASECRRVAMALDNGENEYIRYPEAMKLAVSISGLRVPGAYGDDAASLIAAAPELLEALEKISKIEDRYNCGDWDEIEEAREIARGAIAKAKGETK